MKNKTNNKLITITTRLPILNQPIAKTINPAIMRVRLQRLKMKKTNHFLIIGMVVLTVVSGIAMATIGGVLGSKLRDANIQLNSIDFNEDVLIDAFTTIINLNTSHEKSIETQKKTIKTLEAEKASYALALTQLDKQLLGLSADLKTVREEFETSEHKLSVSQGEVTTLNERIQKMLDSGCTG